ncbi:MAG: ATP-binding protein [Cyanobacteria bacterium J06641_5]
MQSRLSRRIALSVFGSILAIETLVLLPSVREREQQLLRHLADRSAASLTSIVTSLQAARSRETDPFSSEVLLQHLRQLEAFPFTAGGTLYHKTGLQAGEPIGSFGSAPQLTYAQLRNFEGQKFSRRQQRYDSTWTSPLAKDYLVIVCHDTVGIRQAVVGYTSRIFTIVLLIAGIVALTTITALQPILIAPILALRDDLQRVTPATLGDRRTAGVLNSLPHGRDDELGEVIRALKQAFERISGAISQRQQTAAKLRESKSWFRSLVQQAAEAIFVVNRDGTIADVNPCALSHLNYQADELINRSIFDINPHLTQEVFREQWQQLQAGQPLTFETIHRRKDGQIYPVEVRSSLIRKDGELCVLHLVRDIRDRKNAQAVQARLAEVGELAAMIVHEVRNPLASIYMALTGLQRLELPQGAQLRLGLALEEAERFKRLLNEILTYSKEPKLVGESVEINELCKTLYLSLSKLPAATERQIRLTPCSQKLFASGDRDKLKQVFINLVTNACEAIEPGEVVAWTIQPASKQIQIQVQNGGNPIPPDILPKLTQPFVSTKESGNGLGLAITKRIIEAHGGSLTITSDAVEGTIVTVLLPLPTPPSELA